MIAAALVALALVGPARASVTVDTSEVGTEGPIIKRRILERSDVVLRSHGVLPKETDADVDIAVVVEAFDRGGPGFLLHLDIPAIELRGHLLQNDIAVTGDDAAEIGSLSFVLTGGGRLDQLFAGPFGAHYAVTLMPGDYSIFYVPGTGACSLDRDPPLPCSTEALFGCAP